MKALFGNRELAIEDFQEEMSPGGSEPLEKRKLHEGDRTSEVMRDILNFKRNPRAQAGITLTREKSREEGDRLLSSSARRTQVKLPFLMGKRGKREGRDQMHESEEM